MMVNAHADGCYTTNQARVIGCLRAWSTYNVVFTWCLLSMMRKTTTLESIHAFRDIVARGGRMFELVDDGYATRLEKEKAKNVETINGEETAKEVHTTILVVCMDCQADMGEKDGFGVEGISHGLCPSCYRNRISELRNSRKTE